MTSNKLKNITRISLSAITAVLLITQMLSLGFIFNTANAIPTDPAIQKQTNPIPELNLTNVQKDDMVQKALATPKMQNLSSSGWRYVTMDYLGVTEPNPEWKSVVLHFNLPKEFKTRLNCNTNLEATVEIDLKTNQVISTNMPDESVDCNGSIVFGRPSDGRDQITDLPAFIPTASAVTSSNGLLLAMQNDVSTPKYGGWTTLSTPTISANIYAHMDQFIGHVYNQDFTTAKYLQTGWLISKIAGCPSCSINANSANLVYVDQSTFNNLEAHKVVGTNAPTYTQGSTALVQILCNGGPNYRIQVTSGGKFFQANSLVPCGTSTTNNPANNSVFFENKNTVVSSTWSGDITSAVTGTMTQEYDTTTHFQNWVASDKQYQTCGVNAQFGPTTAITGSLTAGGTATWATLSATPNC